MNDIEKKNFLGLVKDEVQKNFGESGTHIYNESIKKLNIRENASMYEVEKLVSEIGKSLAQADIDSKNFSNELRQKLIVYEKFSPRFWNFLSDNNGKEEGAKSQESEGLKSQKSENLKLEEGVNSKESQGLKSQKSEGLEGKILELLYQNYDSYYILKGLEITEEELADIILCLDNKGLIKNKDKKWILTEKGKDILKLEGKILSFILTGNNIDNILHELSIEEESLADIIIDLEFKELIILKDKNWKLTEKGKDIFKKRENIFKKLKIEYLHGDIRSRDEYNARKKELEEMPQIIFIYEEKRELVAQITDIKVDSK